MSLPYEVVTSEREARAQQHIIRLSKINQPLVRLRRAGGCLRTVTSSEFSSIIEGVKNFV